jgi:hypothetical protein
VQIIGGLWDRAVPPSNDRFLDTRLPNNKLDLIDAGHCPGERTLRFPRGERRRVRGSGPALAFVGLGIMRAWHG